MRLREQAYEAFIRLLLDRNLEPGDFVTQRDLCARLDLPLGAIREAIPRLEADGLIRAIPQRGLQVATLDLRLVREAFQLREVIETAALSHFIRVAPDAVIAALRAKLDRIMQAAEAGVTDALLAEAQAADWEFHNAIVASMDNHLVSEVHRVNLIRIRVIMQDRATLSAAILPPSLSDHAATLTAIARRDEAAAVAALRAHLESARRRALRVELVEADPALSAEWRRA
jgi:DNA-binding GntR family transcriptional regulator